LSNASRKPSSVTVSAITFLTVLTHLTGYNTHAGLSFITLTI
jgi:hypothetical protein